MTTTNSEPGRYGQYCPLALAAELLCERWTLLVVSRLLDGCRSFNEIHRGLPRISPSLLTKRLRELEHAGLLKRYRPSGNKHYRYKPTPAALELNPIVDGLAAWGQRWGRDMVLDDLDPAFLAWSMSYRLDASRMPAGRTVIGFEFSGAPAELSGFWLVHEGGDTQMCLKDPGLEPDLVVQSDLRRFVEAWRGIRSLHDEIADGKLQVFGPRQLAHAFPDWLQLSAFAGERQRPGREHHLQGESD
ncbi:MAG: helix-turn-helix domain-containing protein [Pseudomonadota bacterium]